MSRHAVIRKIPVDVILILVAIGLSRAIFPLIPGTALKAIVTLPYLLLLPGYVITTIVFPAKPIPEKPLKNRRHALRNQEVATMGIVERIATSFGLSIALLPIIGLLLVGVFGGISERSVIDSLTFLILVGLVGGTIRRVRLPADIRADLVSMRRVRASLVEPPTTDIVLNIGLAFVVLLTASGLTYAVVAPQNGNTYTSVSLLTETKDGELVASGYPTNVTTGEGIDLVFLVENREQQNMNYTTVILLQRVSDSGAVIKSKRLQAFRQKVPSRGSWQVRHTVSPTLAGDRIRLQYLLYRGEAPSNPQRSTAYRSLHLWLSVSE